MVGAWSSIRCLYINIWGGIWLRRWWWWWWWWWWWCCCCCWYSITVYLSWFPSSPFWEYDIRANCGASSGKTGEHGEWIRGVGPHDGGWPVLRDVKKDLARWWISTTRYTWNRANGSARLGAILTIKMLSSIHEITFRSTKDNGHIFHWLYRSSPPIFKSVLGRPPVMVKVYNGAKPPWTKIFCWTEQSTCPLKLLQRRRYNTRRRRTGD